MLDSGLMPPARFHMSESMSSSHGSFVAQHHHQRTATQQQQQQQQQLFQMWAPQQSRPVSSTTTVH